MSRITDAQKRVLGKAAANGFVMAAGGFGVGGGSADPVEDPLFDRPRHIDNLINAKLLTWGEGANQYVLTSLGSAELAAIAQRRRSAGE